MFSLVALDQVVPEDHPLREIRVLVDRSLARMDAELDAMYAPTGRPSIAREKLLRTLLLQVLYSVSSERRMMEQLEYNLLFRWFVGLEIARGGLGQGWRGAAARQGRVQHRWRGAAVQEGHRGQGCASRAMR
jgi:hypothetical protein